MICLTGDVHHMSMKGADQFYLQGTEIDAAEKYIEIASDFGIKITLFVAGKCVKEEKRKIKALLSNGNIELGGHTYRCFRPRLLYKLSYRILNRKNGPWFLQNYEIRKTISIFKNALNYHIVSWRDHGYRQDRNTRKILATNGVRYCSDSISNNMAQPKWNDGVIDVPINTIPDHDYVYHGGRQPGSFDEESLWNSVFKTGAMGPSDWLEKVKGQIMRIEEYGGVATILAHPACMEVMDDFKTFRKLCSFLSKFHSVKMNEIIV